jgi:hypothetical protein
MCEWAAEDVPKVIEARKKTTIPSAIKVIAELSLFGQHKGIFIYDSPDEKTLFKALTNYLQISTMEITPAVTPEDSIDIVTGN